MLTFEKLYIAYSPSVKMETAMKTYHEAKKWMTIRVLGLAAIAGLVLMRLVLVMAAGTIADKLVPLLTP